MKNKSVKGQIMSTWKVIHTKEFEKSLKRLSHDIARRVLGKIYVLEDDPFVGKPLRSIYAVIDDNKYRVYSLRIGNYRVAYIIETLEKKVYLLLADHRGRIYRELKKLFKS